MKQEYIKGQFKAGQTALKGWNAKLEATFGSGEQQKSIKNLKNIQLNGKTSKATAADLAAGVTPRRREAQIRAKIKNKIRLDLPEMSPQNIAL